MEEFDTSGILDYSRDAAINSLHLWEHYGMDDRYLLEGEYG